MNIDFNAGNCRKSHWKKWNIKNFANSKLFSLKIDLPHKVCLTSSTKLERESTKNVSVICVGKVSGQVSASLKLKWTFYGPTWILWNRYCLHLFRISPRPLLINKSTFFTFAAKISYNLKFKFMILSSVNKYSVLSITSFLII